MELILNQLELGTQHSLVLTEKLFKHNKYQDIQDFQKQIQLKLLKKNNQLKDIFSTKYQELLDCSELVNGITGYTSRIVQISNDCTNFLSEIQDPTQNSKSMKTPQEVVSQSKLLRSKLLSISNKISKLQSKGFIFLPSILADDFISTLQIIHCRDSQIKILCDEYLFLFRQMKQTVVNSVRKGYNLLPITKVLLGDDQDMKLGIIFDLLHYHLKYSQGNYMDGIFGCLNQSQPYQQFKIALVLCNLLNQVQVHNLQLNHKDHIDDLLMIDDFSDLSLLILKNQIQTTSQPLVDKSQITKTTQQFIDRVVKCLHKDDYFDHVLFQQVLQDQSIDCKEWNIQLLFETQWHEYQQNSIQKILSKIQIKTPQLEKYSKDIQVSASNLQKNNYDSHLSIIKCQSQWLQDIRIALGEIDSLVAYPKQFPQIYNYESCQNLIQRHFDEFYAKRRNIQSSLYEDNQGDYKDQIRVLAKVTLAFNILNNLWIQQLEEHKMNIKDSLLDLSSLEAKLAQIFNETKNQQTEETFISLLEEILTQGSSRFKELKTFASTYIGCLKQQYELSDLLSNSIQNYIQYSNILCLLNPEKHFNDFKDTLGIKENKSSIQSVKQLLRPTPPIKQQEQDSDINFLLFPCLYTVPIKRQEPVKVDQEGLKMWSQSMPQQPPKTQPNVVDSSKMNRFGMAFQQAKERTTSLLYKQYQ